MLHCIDSIIRKVPRIQGYDVIYEGVEDMFDKDGRVHSKA